MRDHGLVIGATRLAKRVWQLYVAHVMLLVIYVAAVVYVALRFRYDNLLHEFNIAYLTQNPIRTLIEGLALRFKPYGSSIALIRTTKPKAMPPPTCFLMSVNVTAAGGRARYSQR
jgi:hypothetical protein